MGSINYTRLDPPWPTTHANVHINLTLKLKKQFFSLKNRPNEEGIEAVSNDFRSNLEVVISKSYGGYTRLLGFQLGYPLRNDRAER
jgi:hypothetical protein